MQMRISYFKRRGDHLKAKTGPLTSRLLALNFLRRFDIECLDVKELNMQTPIKMLNLHFFSLRL